MIRTDLPQIARWLDLVDGMPPIAVIGVSTDTRSLAAGNLFVALQGPNFDAHDYLEVARDKGAVAAVVSRRRDDVDLPQLLVDDTLKALQRLAYAWRHEVDPLVVGITGSAGKTTVKQLLAAIFGVAGRTLATQGNLNNDIGVPLTLLALDREDRYAVIEMGANHVGEIARLTRVADPDHALVTMAGRAHLGEFGSVENIIRAKGELYTGLGKDAQAVINLDSAGSDEWIRHCPVHWDGFAMGGSSHAEHATWVGVAGQVEVLTVLEHGGELLAQQPLPLPGQHNRVNLLAAVALARQAGCTTELIREGLAAFEPPQGRMQVERLIDGLQVIDDSYNANPESMRAAMGYLAARPGCRIAVLGDMGELGDQAADLHRELAGVARELGLDAVVTLGELAAAAASANENVCADVDSVVARLLTLIGQAGNQHKQSTILVKGSRFMHMERVLAGLRERLAATVATAAGNHGGEH